MGNSKVLRTVATWLLCLMLAVAAAALTIVLVNAFVFSPQHQVKAYFNALEDGNGGTALGLLHATVPDANAAMLDGAALKASVDTLENLEIQDPVPAGDNRVDQPVSYTVDGVAHTTTFTLEKTGTTWLFFNQWSFVPSTLPTISVDVVNGNEASLNGTRVALPEGKSSFAVFYPGSFEAHYASDYFAAPVVESVLTGPQNAPDARLSLATEATPKLVDDLSGQVNAFLDSCAEQRVLQPSGCPFSASMDRVQDDTIDWSIEEYPEVKVEPFKGSWVLSPLRGVAKLNVVEIDLFTGASVERELKQDFDFTGRLSVNDGHVTLTPVVEY
ncbi:hypothetical protein [Arthrobacter sp. NPDC089319]|uniref:hypothetical protein n=1 Tax=Arthrobacter sp. NPDC089319 TaxID=3155915 RepID=UPI003419FFC7